MVIFSLVLFSFYLFFKISTLWDKNKNLIDRYTHKGEKACSFSKEEKRIINLFNRLFLLMAICIFILGVIWLFN